MTAIAQDRPIEDRQIEKLPSVTIKRSWLPFPIVWIVPVIAAFAAGFLLYQRYQGLGPKIEIVFSDANGIKPGETSVQYRGVVIGLVNGLELSPDLKQAKITVRLKRSAAEVAKTNSVFWIVRPEVAANTISGLGTVFSGPYITVAPGSGERKVQFAGLAKEPLSAAGGGVHVILNAAHLNNIIDNSPIYFRGVKVGEVESVEVSDDGLTAAAHAFIQAPYNRLVEPSSKFWNVSGADVHGGLLSGLDLKIESLRSLLSGGVAFASPGGEGPAKNGAKFTLVDEPKDEWLAWSPKIPLPAGQIKQQQQDTQDKDSEAVGPAVIKKEK